MIMASDNRLLTGSVLAKLYESFFSNPECLTEFLVNPTQNLTSNPIMAGGAEQLIQQLNGVVATTLESDDFTRQQLAMAARKLFHQLETKEEKTFRLAIEEPIMFSVLQAAIDMGVWDAWTAAGGGEREVEELASMATKDVDPELLRKPPELT